MHFGKIIAVLNSICLPLLGVDLIVIPIVIFLVPRMFPHVTVNPGWLGTLIGLVPRIPLAPRNLISTASALPRSLRGDSTSFSIILGRSTRGNLPSTPQLPPVDSPVCAHQSRRLSPVNSHQSRQLPPVDPHQSRQPPPIKPRLPPALGTRLYPLPPAPGARLLPPGVV